jgi:hypothetical protein
MSFSASIAVTAQPRSASHWVRSARSSMNHRSEASGRAWRRSSRLSGSKKLRFGVSTAIRLPGALSVTIRSNNRSCPAAGKKSSSPSADHAVGVEGSKPAFCKAVGQSDRRSIGTA